MKTAERLIESTRELLWERGYVGTSPRAILSRAGVGQGSMYHHFSGKQQLALAAITRTADEMRAAAETRLSAPGTALERITGYLRRERDALKGCPIGRLTQDPDVMADPVLRAPVDETFGWLRRRLGRLLTEGQEQGQLSRSMVPDDVACTVVATLQGGYVVARAAGSTRPFEQAVTGVLALVASQATAPSHDPTK